MAGSSTTDVEALLRTAIRQVAPGTVLRDGLERILREGIMRGAFPRLDPAVAAACIVGAFMEALIGPLAPAKGTGPRADRHLIEQITAFCLRASVGAPEGKP